MAYPDGLFSWTDISLPDPAGGSKFYADLYGWHGEDQHDPDGNYIYTMFSKDGKGVAGLGPQPPGMAESGIPPMWISYVAVDDLDATIDKWTAAGGTVMMPAMDVMDAGRMAFVIDPLGAVLALWQAGAHAGAEAFTEHGTMTWNELATRDSEAARSFYAAALGWEFEELQADAPVEMEYWMVVLDSKVSGQPYRDDKYNGGVITMNENWPEDVPSHWMVYFQVDDTDESVARLESLGGKVSVPAFDSSAGRIAVVGDPQGGTFSIIAPSQVATG
jgi:hypothetical protein